MSGDVIGVYPRSRASYRCFRFRTSRELRNPLYPTTSQVCSGKGGEDDTHSIYRHYRYDIVNRSLQEWNSEHQVLKLVGVFRTSIDSGCVVSDRIQALISASPTSQLFRRRSEAES